MSTPELVLAGIGLVMFGILIGGLAVWKLRTDPKSDSLDDEDLRHVAARRGRR